MFDPTKPYGVITSHSWARFEQDGVLYDWQGNSPEAQETFKEEQEDEIPVDFSAKDFEVDNAKAFLLNILAGGPVARSAIFKECSLNNQDWDKVKTAFSVMDGEIIKRRNVIHWKLKSE